MFTPCASYSGRELSELSDDIIVHRSAHTGQKQRNLGPVMRLLRQFEVQVSLWKRDRAP